MKLNIYNTLSWKKEEFFPLIEEGTKKFVGIYSCGPTVYSTPHIWNLKAFLFADLLRNTIKNLLWYPTKHVVNITDVGHLTDDCDFWEDKMEKAAKKESISCRDIARKYENIFLDCLEKLNIENFDHIPRATEHIQEQIDLIKKIENKWATYKTSDWIYMDTSKIKDYWKLIWEKHIQWLQAWNRVQIWEKRNSTDFALWKFSSADEKRQMERDSPWWKWFPWWHVECSAMSEKYLWKFFDIHTGGFDHIPVHHTNEIAQSECANNVSNRVKYWMHVKFLNLKWEKFAKSTWNVIYLESIVEKWYSPLSFRYFILWSNYRHFQDFDWEIFDSKDKGYKKLIKNLTKIYSNLWIDIQDTDLQDIPLLENQNNSVKKIIQALLDDFNTAEMFANINSFISDFEKYSQEEAIEITKAILALDKKVLKLDMLKQIQKRKNEKIPDNIIKIAEQREEARKNKDFSKADELREEIKKQGYTIKDETDWYSLEKI